MRRSAAALLVLVLLLTLPGCGARANNPPQPTASPAAVPTPAATIAPTATPEPTATPAPTPEPTPPPPTWVRLEKGAAYTLFTGTGAGAEAFRSWLLGEGSALLGSHMLAGTAEPMFALQYAPRDDLPIPAAGEEDRLLRLATDETILESGVLEVLLPVFESGYGYTVEVYTGSAADVQSWAGSAAADLALLAGTEASGLNRRGFAYITPLVTAAYALEP